MHLLISLDRYYPIGGGIQQYVRGLATWMTQHGHTITILTGSQEGWPEREILPEGTLIRSPLLADAFAAPEKMLERVAPLMDLIREIAPDVVYGNNHTSIGIVPAAKAAGRPVAYQCHGWGVFCPLKIRLWRPNGELCYNARSLHQCIRCAGMQSPLPPIRGKGRTLIKSLWKRLNWPSQLRRYMMPLVTRYDQFQAILEQADALIMGSSLIASMFSVPSHVLPLGIEMGMFRPVDATPFRTRFGLGESPYLVLTARLHPTKGHLWAIRALQYLPSELKLVMIGATITFTETNFQHNDYTAKLEAEIAALGLQDRVIFTGALYGEDTAQAYSGAVASLVPSIWLEPFGYITADAMACGTPVIITQNSGSADLVTEGISGAIVPREDAHALAEAVLRIWPRRDVMGEAARQTIETRVSWDVIGPQTVDILQSLQHSS
jgi:glycosyltransferase involved in cell wall biosynthesis